jgi:hypothetical protein
MDEARSKYGGEKRSKQGFDENAEGKRPLGRRRHRWGDNIKMDLQEVRWWAWTGLMWFRFGAGGELL